MSPVVVVGVGWVGLVTAACFADLGHEVVARDVIPEKVESLSRGEVTIHEPGLAELLERNRERLTFTTDIDEVLSAARLIFVCVDTPPTYSGDADEFAKSLAGQPWLILAAMITIYIVLGVLYESFIHPFTILTTLPSAGIGAVLALLLCGLDLSLVALIGIVLLMGIVKKNAIMMIDFALDAERNEGMSPEDAIYKAALLRFRPILMTTLAALFGALPLMLSTGSGAEMRQPLGLVMVGGLLLSQVLTLFTTPAIYLFFDRLGHAWARTGRSLDTKDATA